MSSETQILTFLKRRGAQATAAIARHLKISLPGTRKHLRALTKARLVSFIDERRGVGRPRRLWQLTEEAQARFPDGHDVVTVELIEAIREGFGEWASREPSPFASPRPKIAMRRRLLDAAIFAPACKGLPSSGARRAIWRNIRRFQTAHFCLSKTIVRSAPPHAAAKT